MIPVKHIDHAVGVLDALRRVEFHAVAHHLSIFIHERKVHLSAGLNVVRCGRVNLPNVGRNGLLLRRLRGLNRLRRRVRLGVAWQLQRNRRVARQLHRRHGVLALRRHRRDLDSGRINHDALTLFPMLPRFRLAALHDRAVRLHNPPIIDACEVAPIRMHAPPRQIARRCVNFGLAAVVCADESPKSNNGLTANRPCSDNTNPGLAVFV